MFKQRILCFFFMPVLACQQKNSNCRGKSFSRDMSVKQTWYSLWLLTFFTTIVAFLTQSLLVGPILSRSLHLKFLGVHLSEDFTWAVHCDYIVKKANRRLYALLLRQLKKCKVPSADIVHIYCALIHSILEYASAVFAGLPKYLACYLENVQKRALSIIWPGISY